MADSDRKIHDSQTLVDDNLLTAKAFTAAGVTHMFGVLGIPVTSFASRAVSIGILFLAFHNEQSAGYAASAYDYLTGKPDLLLIVSSPSCVHGLVGLSNAAANTWPMVMISGSCDQADFDRGDFQELDQVAAVEPFSKFSAKATDISQIPKSVFKVLDQALSGRPDGCYFDLPTDVLHQTVSQSEAKSLLAAVENSRTKPQSPSVEPSLIEKAVSLLRQAKRPLIVFRKEVAFARVENSIKTLVESTGIPFLPTPMGNGLFPDMHELDRCVVALYW